MIDFIFYTLLFFGVYQVGRLAGRAEERIVHTRVAKRKIELYDKVIRLAELKGEDVLKLTDQEILNRMAKLEADTKDNGSIY